MQIKIYIIIIILCLGFTTQSQGQSRINGIVVTHGTRVPIGNVNIILKEKGSQSIKSFTNTKSDGRYELLYNGTADSLTLTISALAIGQQHKIIANKSQTIDFSAENKDLEIKEVVVTSQSITRRSDTLNYYTSAFTDAHDRTLSDIIKKMPGLMVAPSGSISYMGKDISKLYIEGLDMLGQGYGVATNNISARDVSVVQVLDGHEPIKARQKRSALDQVAVNIKLKESVKNVFMLNAKAGFGYKPAIWDSELIGMMFGRKAQFMSTYKTNNIGDDVSREHSMYDQSLDASMLSVRMPTIPPLNQKRYLDNNIHAISLNNLYKLSADDELKINLKYTNDLRNYEGETQTVIYNANDTIRLNETAHKRQLINRGGIDMIYLSNRENVYLSDVVSATGSWGSDFGRVYSNADLVEQAHSGDRYAVSNRLFFTKNFDNLSLEVLSTINYNSTPFSLDVLPSLFDNLYPLVPHSGLRQRATVKGINTNNSVKLGYKVARHNFSLDAGFGNGDEKLTTSLKPIGTAIAEDSLTNNNKFRSFTPYVTPAYAYNSDNFKIGASVKMEYTDLRLESGSNQKTSRPTFNPSANFEFKISPNLKLDGMAIAMTNFGGIMSNYNGYIMTDYRTISSLTGLINKNEHQNYRLKLSYSNTLASLFTWISGSHWKNKANVMYSYTFQDNLNTVQAVERDNRSDGYSIDAHASKRFQIPRFPFTLKIDASYRRSNFETLRQADLIASHSDRISLVGSLNFRLTKVSTFEYAAQWSQSISKTDGGSKSLDPIESLTQSAKIHATVAKKILLTIAAESYFNNAIHGKGRNSYFLDANATYKFKKIDIQLEISNILNTKAFCTAFYGDMIAYNTSYSLRSRAVMLSARFKII